MRFRHPAGRIARGPIDTETAWALALAVVSWGLVASVLPTARPALAGRDHGAMAGLIALLFAVALAGHELAHGLVARHERARPLDAGAELRVAIAGPLTSALLGTALLIAAALAPLGASLDDILVWAGAANLALAALSLVPGPPLDGGRILQAALRHAMGDAATIAVVAGGVATLAAATMIAAGVVVALGMDALGGVGLVILGWFLLARARAEARLAVIERALAGFVVADLMNPDPLVSQSAQTLAEFMAQIPQGDRADAYPVLDGERPVGVLPAPRDVTGHRWSIERVRDRMLRLDRVPLLRIDEPAPEAVTAMLRANAGSALVLEGGRLAGIVSSRDITEALKIGNPPR